MSVLLLIIVMIAQYGLYKEKASLLLPLMAVYVVVNTFVYLVWSRVTVKHFFDKPNTDNSGFAVLVSKTTV